MRGRIAESFVGIFLSALGLRRVQIAATTASPVCLVPKCHTHKPDGSEVLLPQELRADRSNSSMPFTFFVPEACSGGDLVLVSIPPIIYSVVSLVLPPGKLPGSDLTFHAPNGALLQ